MPIIMAERYGSQSITRQANHLSSVQLLFFVLGTEIELLARAKVESLLPQYYLPRGWPEHWALRFDSYTLEHLGGGVYDVRASYVARTDPEFSFDTSGGRERITQSLWTVYDAAPNDASAAAPDHKGAIGVDDESVHGTEITVPQFQWTETHRIDRERVTFSYIRAIYFLTGKVNDAPFRGFARGEVLFLGARGSRRGVEKWELTYTFAANPNREDIEIGRHGPPPEFGGEGGDGPIIGPFAKEGWQYLWIEYQGRTDANAKRIVRRPIAAHVEQVYSYGDFGALLLPDDPLAPDDTIWVPQGDDGGDGEEDEE